jgi:organic radical activating enzyme
MDPVFKIHEIFDSVQGEGIRTGTWTTFVRFAGCNLQCSFCDTPGPEAKDIIAMNSYELIQTISKRNPRYIVLTGGEPCLQITQDLIYQLQRFSRVAIETNGTVDNPAIGFASHVTVSPKTCRLAESYYRLQPVIHEMRILVTKFVVQIPDLRKLNIHHLIFSPEFDAQGNLDPKILQKTLRLVRKFRFRGARLSVQIHKLLGLK